MSYRLRPIQKKIIAFSLFWALYVAGCLCPDVPLGKAEIVSPGPGFATKDAVLKVMIGEAVEDGPRGMQAVGEVIRRRKSLKPFDAHRRRDLDRFVRSQGPEAWRAAELAWERSARSNLTLCATHYATGRPWWSRKMLHTVTIGSHRFYKDNFRKCG